MAACFLLISNLSVFAQGTVVTYQGRVTDNGTNFNGTNFNGTAAAVPAQRPPPASAGVW